MVAVVGVVVVVVGGAGRRGRLCAAHFRSLTTRGAVSFSVMTRPTRFRFASRIFVLSPAKPSVFLFSTGCLPVCLLCPTPARLAACLCAVWHASDRLHDGEAPGARGGDAGVRGRAGAPPELRVAEHLRD